MTKTNHFDWRRCAGELTHVHFFSTIERCGGIEKTYCKNRIMLTDNTCFLRWLRRGRSGSGRLRGLQIRRLRKALAPELELASRRRGCIDSRKHIIHVQDSDRRNAHAESAILNSWIPSLFADIVQAVQDFFSEPDLFITDPVDSRMPSKQSSRPPRTRRPATQQPRSESPLRANRRT